MKDKTNKHPIQNLIKSEKGVLHFQENKIVTYLLDMGPFDMNHLITQEFSNEDFEQFLQLIGYNVDGFYESFYVSNKAKEKVKLLQQEIENKA